MGCSWSSPFLFPPYYSTKKRFFLQLTTKIVVKLK